MDLLQPLSLQWIIPFLFPSRCVLCRRPAMENLDLCPHCYARLPWNHHSCRQCAITLADGPVDSLAESNVTDVLCGRCLQTSPYFDTSYSVFRYQGDIISMVHQFKFHQRLLYSRLFGQLLLDKLQQQIAQSQPPDYLLPVPLHPSRLRQRGYNQSVELAKVLARGLQVPLQTNCLVRSRKTLAQAGLGAKQRRSNIKGAFELVHSLADRHIALVDDVVTTGSTVNEIARVLKESGAKRVDVYSIARA